jgi:hypothetical protein
MIGIDYCGICITLKLEIFVSNTLKKVWMLSILKTLWVRKLQKKKKIAQAYSMLICICIRRAYDSRK